MLAGLLAMRVSRALPARRPRAGRRSCAARAKASRYARQTARSSVILGMMVVFSSICFNFNILLPLLAKDTLDAGPRTFGIVSACFGAGALVGALSRRRWRTHAGGSCSLGAAGFGVTELLIAPVHATSSRARCSSSAACSSRATARTRTPRSSSRAATPSAAASSASTTTRGTGSPRSARWSVGWLCDRGGTELAFTVAGFERARDDRRGGRCDHTSPPARGTTCHVACSRASDPALGYSAPGCGKTRDSRSSHGTETSAHGAARPRRWLLSH